jgi:uncharacterized protein (DUF58 family)
VARNPYQERRPGDEEPKTFLDELPPLIDRMLARTPDGRPLVEPPWENPFIRAALKLPWYAQPGKRPAGVLLISGFALTFFGVVLLLPGVAALGAGLAALVIATYRRGWQAIGAVRLELPPARLTVHERDEVRLTAVVRNTSRQTVGPFVVRLGFAGTTTPERWIFVTPLRAFERRQLPVTWEADRGMGEFPVERTWLMGTDPLGLFRLCVASDPEITVEVLPELTELPPLPIKAVGQTMHSGVFESKRSGDSPTFFGLRPYQIGDSVRRIDWRRSQRHNSLVVRDYERLNATDATLLVDRRHVAWLEFGRLNSFEAIRDAAIALARGLMAQQIRVRFVSGVLDLPFGKGAAHFDLITEAVQRIRADDGAGLDFAAEMARVAEEVPPDSVLIPIFARAGVDFDALLETFYRLDERRVQILPVIVDTDAYATAIAKAARFTGEQHRMVWMARVAREGEGNAQSLDRFAERLQEATTILGPEESLADALKQEVVWTPPPQYA